MNNEDRGAAALAAWSVKAAAAKNEQRKPDEPKAPPWVCDVRPAYMVFCIFEGIPVDDLPAWFVDYMQSTGGLWVVEGRCRPSLASAKRLGQLNRIERRIIYRKGYTVHSVLKNGSFELLPTGRLVVRRSKHVDDAAGARNWREVENRADVLWQQNWARSDYDGDE